MLKPPSALEMVKSVMQHQLPRYWKGSWRYFILEILKIIWITYLKRCGKYQFQLVKFKVEVEETHGRIQLFSSFSALLSPTPFECSQTWNTEYFFPSKPLGMWANLLRVQKGSLTSKLWQPDKNIKSNIYPQWVSDEPFHALLTEFTENTDYDHHFSPLANAERWRRRWGVLTKGTTLLCCSTGKYVNRMKVPLPCILYLVIFIPKNIHGRKMNISLISPAPQEFLHTTVNQPLAVNTIALCSTS